MSNIVRYWQVARATLATEKARNRVRLLTHEPDFLPAALEIVERPVSPTARWSAWVLMAGLVVTLAWLVLGHIDVVASAQGRIIPTDDVKLVQAANTGIVRHIYVNDGDSVQKGQPLIDLDPTVSTAEEAEATKALMAAELDVARNQAISDALGGKGIHFSPPPGTPLDIVDTQRKLIEQQVASTDASVASFAAARDSSLADAKAASDTIRKYNETLPLLDNEVAAMNELDAKGYAPGLKLTELQRQRRSEAGDRDIAVAQQARGFSDARKFGAQVAESRAQARQQALADLAKAQTEATLRHEELAKAQQHSALQRLVAPVNGMVQQLAVHTVGGVVEPVRALMVVVPDGAVIVEAHVRNQDAGFVRAGQGASIKLAAFPFTRYGAVPGHILSISRDAVRPEKGKSYFVARVALDQRSMWADGRWVPLTPGLEAVTDIKIGSRRIISYLVSPIQATAARAAREK
jgi:hemolysin D